LEGPVLPAEVLERSEERSNLLCYVDGQPWPEAIERVCQWVAALRQVRDWAVGPPEFVNEFAGNDHTVGVVLRLLPAFDLGGRENPPEVERELLADAEALVASAQRFTDDGTVGLAFELDGESVGWVEGGSADQMLTEGLLDPWRARVAERLSAPQPGRE
jgi:hypothetical protein